MCIFRITALEDRFISEVFTGFARNATDIYFIDLSKARVLEHKHIFYTIPYACACYTKTCYNNVQIGKIFYNNNKIHTNRLTLTP